MAEVLGVFASSVQVAALAGQIASIGLKIRALYQEIQDAPDELAFRLQELKILSDILKRSDSVSLNAGSFCERCLLELGLVLGELESHVKKYRGLRQKVASTKVVLKKQLIQKLDSRFCRSVQLLQLATYSHMLQNQDAMMSILKAHFGQSTNHDETMSPATLKLSCIESGQTKNRVSESCAHSSSANCPAESDVWYPVQSINDMSRRAWTFGFPFVTGTVHFGSNSDQNPCHYCSNHECMGTKGPNESCLPTAWARFALPRWLSYRVLEVVAHRSRIGWKQYIRVRNVFPRLDGNPGTPFHGACENIAFGDLERLRTQIEKKEVTPWDEDSRGETMWATAFYFSQWEICNFLMDLGAEPSPKLPMLREHLSWLVEDLVGLWDSRAVVTSARKRAMEVERRKLIGRLDDNDGLRFSLLSGIDGTVDEFTGLKSSIWPNESFYHREFSEQRMRFAVSIACAPTNATVAPSMIRSVLGLDNTSVQPVLDFKVSNSFGKTILHGLASKIATTAGRQNSADWRRLTRDILSYVKDIQDLSHDSNGLFFIGFKDIGRKTPLMSLIADGIFTESQLCRQRLNGPNAVISGCEKSIMAWLEDLHTSGVDLAAYGRNEKKCSQDPVKTHEPGKFPSVLAHSAVQHQVCGTVCLLQLIDFQYGRLLTDWKFWWSEPSDEFAGEFWSLIERESERAVISVPGAWVD